MDNFFWGFLSGLFLFIVTEIIRSVTYGITHKGELFSAIKLSSVELWMGSVPKGELLQMDEYDYTNRFIVSVDPTDPKYPDNGTNNSVSICPLSEISISEVQESKETKYLLMRLKNVSKNGAALKSVTYKKGSTEKSVVRAERFLLEGGSVMYFYMNEREVPHQIVLDYLGYELIFEDIDKLAFITFVPKVKGFGVMRKIGKYAHDHLSLIKNIKKKES